MLKVPNLKDRFTQDVIRGIVYRVRVQRQDMSGGKAGWEDLPPAKGAPAPADSLSPTMPEGELPGKIAEIDSQFQWIQLPPFYVDALGQPVPPPILGKSIPPRIAAENAQLHADIEAARTNLQSAGGPRLTAAPGVAATGPADTALPTTMEGIRALDVQPFTFWDDSVKPDHKYRYQVKIELVNPAFGWKWGLAPNQAVTKLDPVIPLKDSGFVAVPEQVVVHSDLAFFIRGTGVGNTGITGPLFKQEGGRWYSTSFSVPRGMNIAASLTIAGKTQEVDTKFTVVDYQESGSNVHVILKDPNGNLVTRDSADDGAKIELNDLMDKVRQGAAITATAPAEGTSGTPGRGTATPPTRGTTVNPPATSRGTTPVPVRP
jgi:hypothetical protein